MPYKSKEKKQQYNKAYYLSNQESLAIAHKRYSDATKPHTSHHHKLYYVANRERIIANAKRYATLHKEKISAYHKVYSKKHKYGLSQEDISTMLAAQQNACAICGIAFDKLVKHYIDHDHSLEGRESVRGILCVKCNSGLGQFRDSPELLETAKSYLTRHK